MTKTPEIILSRSDAERLEQLLEGLGGRNVPGIAELEAEIARARVVADGDVPAHVVTMNSTVRFKVASSDSEFSLTLVYPRDADGSSEKVSVLAPVGGALLGLAEGDEIAWPMPAGGMLQVKIIQVTYQPERSAAAKG